MQSAMMWFNPTNDRGKILIEPHVIDLVRGYSQNHHDSFESGGILLGYRRDDHLHIVDATIPQLGDKCMRFRFFRRDANHQKIALKRWKLSGNTMDYIGEWHTHPESMPTPSSLDMSEWKKIYGTRQAGMVFLIVGWTGSIWLGVGLGQCICQATECKDITI